MVEILESVANTTFLSGLDLTAVGALNLKGSYERREQGLPRNSIPEYSCDASCDNCHCATY